MDGAQAIMPQLRLRISQLFGAAMPQIVGLVAQIIIIKLIAIPEVAFRLPIYNSAISVTSIVFLGLAYRQNRFIPGTKHIVVIQGTVLSYLLFFYISEGEREYFISGLFISVLASVSIILLQIIPRCTRSKYLIGATILSAIAPNILWLDLPKVLGIASALICVTLVMSTNVANKNTEKSLKLKQSIYSIVLQMPMLSLTLFDPMISQIMGIQAYVDYAISLKITNGIFLLLFSHIQLEVLQNDRFDINLKTASYFVIFMTIAICINSLFIGTLSVFIQCIILSIIINILSVIVRYHLRFETIKSEIAVFVGIAELIYFIITYALYISNIKIENYAVAIALFIVFASFPLLFRSFRRPDINTRTTNL